MTVTQDIQVKIKDLLQELEDWSSHALKGFASPGGNSRGHVEREYTLLQMHYWSTKLLITRPCLCRTERRIKNQSDTSAGFNSEMAGICVDFARALTAMFPQKPDFNFVYMEAPWWNIVHISKSASLMTWYNLMRLDLTFCFSHAMCCCVTPRAGLPDSEYEGKQR